MVHPSSTGAEPESGRAAAKQPAFRALQQSAFADLQHAAFHKGLLKPFKGKGELAQFALSCRQLTEQLIQLASHDVLGQAERYPFTLLPIRLTRQSTSAGTVFLRWTRVDRRQMGVALWEQLLEDPRTPAHLLDDLFALEQQRITLNMQISLFNTLGRQASACAEKLGQAESVYRQRIHSIHRNAHKEA